MKMKYIWDGWNGEGELPDNSHAIELRDGSVEYESSYKVFTPDSAHTGALDDIMSYCIAVPDNTGEEL